jgi:leucyl aminopeptidase (aminopeptidase T)
MKTLSDGARKVIQVCAACKKDEKLLIVTDDIKKGIAEVFRQTAVSLGISSTTLAFLPAEEHGGQEPPPPVAQAMCDADVVLAITSKSISQTMARVNALKHLARIVNLPDISEKDLTEGLIEADFATLSPAVKAVASHLEQGSRFRVTAAGGTDLSFSGEGQQGNAFDALADKGGLFRSMSVEANIGPVDETSEGILVIDGSLPPVGVLREKITCDIRRGSIVNITGDRQAEKLSEILRAYHDPQMYMVAEFGIGMNPCAKLTGHSYLADESALGTVHFGFGTNLSQGGTRKAAAHFDAIILTPSIEIDGIVIMKKGVFTVPLYIPS